MTKAQTIFFLVCITALAFTVFSSVGKKVSHAADVTQENFH